MILPSDKYSINSFWWFWMPLGVAIGIALVNPFLNMQGLQLLYAENGILEDIQALTAFASVFLALEMLRFCKGNKLLTGWLICAALGSFYIGMEEISWGQQIFHWQSPYEFDLLNDQHETNLHNMSSWLDQKPKWILRGGMFVGGVILPLLRRYKPSKLPVRFAVLYPEDAFFWPAVLAVVTDMLSTKHRYGVYARASEVCEFYMYYFILLYLVMLRKRLKKYGATPPESLEPYAPKA